jgi:hypothetical protein
MFILVALTGAAGLLTSVLLLRLHVHKPARSQDMWRYSI